MRLPAAILLSIFVAVVYSAPVEEQPEIVPVPSTLAVIKSSPDSTSQELESSTVVIVEEIKDELDTNDQTLLLEEATTTQPEEISRDGRQVNDDDDGDVDDDTEGDDDDEEEDEEEEEEEEVAASRNHPPVKAAGKNKKNIAVGKPVTHLGEVEDDEAEDLGIGFDGSPKSDEKSSDEETDDKEKAEDEENDDEDDESGEDEDRDEPSQQGLVADPSSSETRGDVEETPIVQPAAQNEVEQPLAIAVVQSEEPVVPVVPVIVEETAPATPVENSQPEQSKKQKEKKNATKPKKEDDDDEDEEDEEEEEEEDEEADSRSETVNLARAVHENPDILYYYPYPESPVVPEVQQIVQFQGADEEPFLSHKY